MEIKSIRINNFYSFKEAELDFTKYNGIVKIVGVNKDSNGSNGSGKSTIFEAVSWGLYGKTIRKSTEAALINSTAGSNCYVEITIHQPSVGEIVIFRSKKPTALNVFINGEARTKENATETQKFIESLLESDHKSFLAATVFGQHSDFNFLDSTPEEKRTIIRNCFNLEDLFAKRQHVKELKSLYTGEQKALENVLKASKSDLEKLSATIPESKYKYVELPPLKAILDAESKISKNSRLIDSSKDTISKIRKEIQKLEQSVKKGVYEEISECPICKSDYTVCQDEVTLESLQKDIDTKKESIKAEEQVIADLTQKNIDLTPAYSSQLWAKYNEKNIYIQQAQVTIDKVNELKQKICDNQLRYDELTKSIEVMKFWEKAFSEQGMIRYIIRNILDYFNLKANEYLSILSKNQFRIEFSDDLTEEIWNNNRKTSYISLSGGEKRRVNLAIMLSLQDLQNKVSRTKTNLLFFDEVCDNIDDLGIEAVHNLLNTLRIQCPDKVIFLITHNNYLNDLFSEVTKLTVEKSKGISKIV